MLERLEKAKLDSSSNPDLHALHISYAVEDLTVLNETVDQLSSHHRVNSSLLIGELLEWRARMLIEDQAYRDALVIMAIGDWINTAENVVDIGSEI